MYFLHPSRFEFAHLTVAADTVSLPFRAEQPSRPECTSIGMSSAVIKCRIVLYDVHHFVSLGDVMLFPGKDYRRSPASDFVAAEDAGRLADETPELVEGAVGCEWYTEHGTPVDQAAFALCQLRRARAGQRGSPQAGDEAVRAVLEGVDTAAVVWIASRAISYMDENGYPEAVAPWMEWPTPRSSV
jgi:hypothetical protein